MDYHWLGKKTRSGYSHSRETRESQGLPSINCNTPQIHQKHERFSRPPSTVEDHKKARHLTLPVIHSNVPKVPHVPLNANTVFEVEHENVSKTFTTISKLTREIDEPLYLMLARHVSKGRSLPMLIDKDVSEKIQIGEAIKELGRKIPIKTFLNKYQSDKNLNGERKRRESSGNPVLQLNGSRFLKKRKELQSFELSNDSKHQAMKMDEDVETEINDVVENIRSRIETYKAKKDIFIDIPKSQRPEERIRASRTRTRRQKKFKNPTDGIHDIGSMAHLPKPPKSKKSKGKRVIRVKKEKQMLNDMPIFD